MVSISHETPEKTASRLESIIQRSRLTLFDEPYAFEEFPLAHFPNRANVEALAMVRDEHVWSQLVKSNDASMELFAVWRFHFPADADNSGFVGWLAARLKASFGTGVFVVCGQNSADDGIYDYWGCPWALRDDVFSEVKRLVSPR